MVKYHANQLPRSDAITKKKAYVLAPEMHSNHIVFSNLCTLTGTEYEGQGMCECPHPNDHFSVLCQNVTDWCSVVGKYYIYAFTVTVNRFSTLTGSSHFVSVIS